MKFMLKYVGAALLAAGMSQAGAATTTYTETFEYGSSNASFGTTPTAGTSALGGTWSEIGPGVSAVVADPALYGLSNHSLQMTGVTSLTYSFTLASASTFTLSFLEGNEADSDIYLYLGTTLLASDTTSTPAFSPFTVGTYSLAAGAHTLTFLHSGSDSYWLDNMKMEVTAVPEPETYAMMLAGLGAVGFMARRRRAA